jgi:hypothetical protein
MDGTAVIGWRCVHGTAVYEGGGMWMPGSIIPHTEHGTIIGLCLLLIGEISYRAVIRNGLLVIVHSDSTEFCFTSKACFHNAEYRLAPELRQWRLIYDFPTKNL